MFSKLGRFTTATALLGTLAVSTAASAQPISIMFYNVYNLFDAQHDQDKEDWTFLPKNFPGKEEYCQSLTNEYYRRDCFESDWTQNSVRIKLNQITKAIKAATNNQLPDMIGLSEVENGNVVGALAEKLGYQKFEITTSPDSRGIDVALMFNTSTSLKFVRRAEHEIRLVGSSDRATRNILEVEFKVGAEKLVVLVNHWPSQSAPAPARVRTAKTAQQIIDERLRKEPGVHFVMMGDFNVVSTDFPHPFNTVTLSEGATNPMLDTYDLLMRSNVSAEVKNMIPPGTYFYPPKMSWDRLDRIFVTRKLNDQHGLEVDTTTFRVLTPQLIRSTYTFDQPQYFNYGTTMANTPGRPNINARTEAEAGFSDHFPVFVKLKIAN